MNRKLVVFILSLFFSVNLFAQKGTLKGVLTEEQNGQQVPLPFANVYIEGTTIGTTSDFDGNFTLSVQPGNHVLICAFMGYETFKKSVDVTEGGLLTVNIQMKTEGIAIEGVEVVAKMNRESEMALMMEQKNAAVAMEAIGAKELSAKGISDASGAVTKITSITKQEGTGTLNVRGLGDRYNTTTLNRLPLPSNDPENKNIDLELFTTDIISHVSIEKTYAASLYGDFGGANIDIVSKRLNGDAFLSVGAKIAQNATVFGIDNFKYTNGPSKLGFYSENVPDIEKIRNNTSYGFKNSWNPEVKKVLPDMGFDLSGGKTFKTNYGTLNTFFTLAFDNEKKYTDRIERIISATGVARTDIQGEEFKYETQSSAMVNLNYSMDKSEFYFNSILLNASDESLISLSGNMRDVDENAFRQREQFLRNMVLVNQLLGEHKLNKGFSIDWGIAYNYVWNTVPDRRQTQFTTYNKADNTGIFDTEAAGANFRYFHDFTDNELAINTSVKKLVNLDAQGNYKHKFTLGYSGKFRNRHFINYQFNHDIPSNNKVNIDNVDAYLNEANFTNAEYKIVIVEPRDANGNDQDGESYMGAITNNGIYGLWEWNISPELLILTGLRGEQVNQKITTRANQIIGIGTNVKTFDFNEIKLLPSISAKYALTDKQNIRIAGSKTYTLPQLQEMPFMSFTGITEETYGNPFLKPSDVYNADIKWEFFPEGGFLSAAAFYKYINNPINKTTLAGTLNSYFVANTGDWAYVYGFELDAKKDLIGTGKRKLYAEGNVSIMDSKMELNRKKIQKETNYNFDANFNDTVSSLQGAAPILANLSLGYSQKWADANSLSLVLVYNYTSDRLYAIGQSGRGNEYEKAMNTLDFIVKSSFGKLGFDLSAKNLLNADYVRIQKNRVEEQADHTIRKYTKGIKYSISLKYNF